MSKVTEKIPKQKINMKTVKRLLSYLRPYKLQLVLVCIFIVMSSLTTVISSLFLKTLIDSYITPMLALNVPDFKGLLRMILIIGGVYLTGILSGLFYGLMTAKISQSALRDIRNDMFSHMQNLPLKYFDSTPHGDIMSRYTNDTDSLRQMLAQSIPNIISSVISILSVFFTMLYLSVGLTSFVLLFTGLIIYIIKKIGKASSKQFILRQKAIGDLNGYIEEMTEGQKVVKAFCREEQIKKEFHEKNEKLFESTAKANKYANVLMPVINNLGYALYSLLAIVGGALAVFKVTNIGLTSVNTVTLGMIASFLQLSRTFINPITQTSQQFNMIVMALAGAERIFELLDEKEEEDMGEVTLVKKDSVWAWKTKENGKIKYIDLKGNLEIKNVSFGYNENEIVLEDISLIAPPGQKIAFVGATGAGKTTITNLINRFYDTTKGKIFYDGIDINNIKKKDLRRAMGMVLQDVNLFTGSIIDNIRYGNPDATDKECIEAAKLVDADSFIRNLKDGYNTVIHGDGSGLSKGQKQLISIARTLVLDPPLLIFDEATSSIDTRTEKTIDKATDKLIKGRTVFIIAHRLSTVRNADVIAVLDKGKIAESGNHEELMAKKGIYYKLYTGAFSLT